VPALPLSTLMEALSEVGSGWYSHRVTTRDKSRN
jgi:hypothetical protein